MDGQRKPEVNRNLTSIANKGKNPARIRSERARSLPESPSFCPALPRGRYAAPTSGGATPVRCLLGQQGRERLWPRLLPVIHWAVCRGKDWMSNLLQPDTAEVGKGRAERSLSAALTRGGMHPGDGVRNRGRLQSCPASRPRSAASAAYPPQRKRHAQRDQTVRKPHRRIRRKGGAGAFLTSSRGCSPRPLRTRGSRARGTRPWPCPRSPGLALSGIGHRRPGSEGRKLPGHPRLFGPVSGVV